MHRITQMHYVAAMRVPRGLVIGLLIVSPATAFAQGTTTPPPVTPPAAPPGKSADVWGGLNAGGLSPPPPLATVAASTEPAEPDIVDDLDDAKASDAERGLSWFWLEAQGGYQFAGLVQLDGEANDLTGGLFATEGHGGVASFGLGAQLIFMTIGVRGRIGVFPEWQMGSFGGELGLKLPLGVVEPRFDLGGGYAVLANLDGALGDAFDLNGFYVRAGAGVDFYPVELLSLGIHATWEVTGFTRSAIRGEQLDALSADPTVGPLSDAQRTTLGQSASGYGAAAAAMGTIGLHF